MNVNSKTARYIFLSIFAFSLFILSIAAVAALTITLQTPGDLTFNATSSKNINFTFVPVWDLTGVDPAPQENASNCTLFTTASGSWTRSKAVNFTNMGIDGYIANGTVSHANFTFTADGNYTWGIECHNFTNATVASGVFFSTNRTFVVDTGNIRINQSINASASSTGSSVTYSVNVTDNIGLATINWSTNVSGTFTAASSTSVAGQWVQVNGTTSFTRGGTFNFSVIAIDTSGNRNSTAGAIVTVADTYAPTVRISYNTSRPSTVINISANLTEETQNLVRANITYNISGVYTSLNYTGVSGLSAQISNASITLPSTVGAVINITVFATDAAGNTGQNTTILTVGDSVAPVVNLTSPSNNSEDDDTTPTFTFLATDNLGDAMTCSISIDDGDFEINGLSATSGSSKSATLNSSSALDDGEYDWQVTCEDTSGNEGTSGTFTFTVDTPSSGGGGGGGSSTAANTAATTGYAWATVEAGDTKSMTLTNSKIAVSEIEYTANEALSGVNIDVSAIKNAPYTATPSASVYQYLDIKAPKLSGKAADIAITFTVTKTWLSTNGVSEDSVRLYRYASSKWNELATEVVSSDSTKVTYKAITPGFSYFAVGTSSGASASPSSDATSTPSTDASAQTSTDAQSTEAQASSGDQSADSSSGSSSETDSGNVSEGSVDERGWKKYAMPIGIALMILIVIAIVVMKRSKQEPTYRY